MARVSVIVPAYAAEPTIGRAIRSLVAQTDPDWEALVVADDAADYRAVLEHEGIVDRRLRFLRTPAPRTGAPGARNVGWAAAEGAFAAPLDADDLWLPERLAVLVPIAAAVGAAADNVRVVEEDGGRTIGTLFPEDGPDRTLDAAAFLPTSVPIMAVVRRDRMSPWDADVDLCDDLPFNLRVIDRTGGLPVIARALHEYRVRDGSICHSPDSGARADRGYATCLRRLAADGMGIEDPAIRTSFAAALRAKRVLNRDYEAWRERRGGGTFQEFLALRPAESPALQYPPSAAI